MKKSIYTLLIIQALIFLLLTGVHICIASDSLDLFDDTEKKIFEYSAENPTGNDLVTDNVSNQVDEIKKIKYRNMTRYYLKEIMTEQGIPSMALIMDTKINNESFYMINSFLGKYIIEKILKSGVMLKDEKTAELFILKVNSKGMNPLENDTSSALDSELRIPQTANNKPATDDDLMNMTATGEAKNNSILEKQKKSSIDNELLFGNLSKDELQTRKKIQFLRKKRRVRPSGSQKIIPIKNKNIQ